MEEEILTSRSNTLLRKIAHLQSSRKYRYEQRLYTGDGTKLFEEALHWIPDSLVAVIRTEKVYLPSLPPDVRNCIVSDALMQNISQMETPEGCIFLLQMPSPAKANVLPGTMILDGVQDPGNLGTILRTADALEVPIILSEGCADPYSPKVVRASMGAVFRTVPAFLSRKEIISSAKTSAIPLYAASLSGNKEDVRSVYLKDSCVIVGSEGQGVCKDFIENCRSSIYIPMSPRCESLNAAQAAAILLWQMTSL